MEGHRRSTTPSAPPLEYGHRATDYGTAAVRPSTLPSAPPPLEETTSSPPEYEAVLEGDPSAREAAARYRSRQLLGSVAYAGATIGRFFGIHDDENQWNPAGTLPPNSRNIRYHMVPREEEPAETLAIITPTDGNSPADSPSQPNGVRKKKTKKWGMGKVSNTIKRLRKRDPTREEVMKSLPTFWPVMTVLIAVIEVALLIATVATGGLAPIKFTPEINTSTIRGFGGLMELASKEIASNFFIGTSKSSLIHTGAMYTPCMRENTDFQVQAAKNRYEENSLRCCIASNGECGMINQDLCTGLYDGAVLGGASRCRSEMNSSTDCSGGVVLHPCCIGLLGECIVTTEDNCTFHGGVWHPDNVVCSELDLDCFKGICEFSWIGKTIGQVPSQGLRFLSAIFLYDGAITLVIVGLFKLYKSWTIEKRIGWLRVVCIYVISGIGGFLFSGLFDPTSVSVGGTGGLFGLLGVNLVELLQGWKWVNNPCLELIKILILVGILLFLGTLPYIDNFTQIGGFIFGVLASFIFVPYITLGKWDRLKKLCLLSVALPIILVLFLFGFVLFYNLENPNFCPECSYVNCIPYTSTFCENFVINFQPFIPNFET